MAKVIQFNEEAFIDSPIYQADRASIDVESLANKIAQDAALMPEVYRTNRQSILQAAFSLSKALAILDGEWGNLIRR